MLIDDIADQIGLAGHPAELDEIIKNMWVDHTHGRISEGDMGALDEAARARRKALQARRTETRPKAASGAPRASARRPRGPREKLFGNGRLVPLDREAKNRIQVLMRALTHPTEPGKHYGAVTAKAEEVGRVLLWVFHNAKTGLCIPSYKTIAKAAGCTEDTVGRAITEGRLRPMHYGPVGREAVPPGAGREAIPGRCAAAFPGCDRRRHGTAFP